MTVSNREQATGLLLKHFLAGSFIVKIICMNSFIHEIELFCE
jgi:hypothetical protein